MTDRLRNTARITAAGLALLVAACTIEDASDKRAADSAAAATAKGDVQMSPSGGAVASPQPAPVTPDSATPTPGATGSATDSAATGSAGMPSTGATGTTGTTGTGATPATSSLSPDSVDVGRTTLLAWERWHAPATTGRCAARR